MREPSTNFSPVLLWCVSVCAQFSVEEVMGRAEVDPRDGRVHSMRDKSACLRCQLPLPARRSAAPAI